MISLGLPGTSQNPHKATVYYKKDYLLYYSKIFLTFLTHKGWGI